MDVPAAKFRSDAVGFSVLVGRVAEQAVQELLADPDLPWHEYRGRGSITKSQVAALLRDYDIRPVVVHPTKRADFSRHGYRAAQFEDAFARSCPTSRTSEHSSAGARRCDARMFGCLPLDGPHREGGLLAGLRTYLPLKSHNLDATIFWFRAPNFGDPASGIANSARHRRLTVTCRICPSAFWRRSAGWTTSGRRYDDTGRQE